MLIGLYVGLKYSVDPWRVTWSHCDCDHIWDKRSNGKLSWDRPARHRTCVEVCPSSVNNNVVLFQDGFWLGNYNVG